jgi:hypothetical protein
MNSGVAWLNDGDLLYILEHGRFNVRSEINHNGFTTHGEVRPYKGGVHHFRLLAIPKQNNPIAPVGKVDIYVSERDYRAMVRSPYLFANRMAHGWENIRNQLSAVEEWWRRLDQ